MLVFVMTFSDNDRVTSKWNKVRPQEKIHIFLYLLTVVPKPHAYIEMLVTISLNTVLFNVVVHLKK